MFKTNSRGDAKAKNNSTYFLSFDETSTRKPPQHFCMLFAILYYGAESKLLVLIRVSCEQRFLCNFEFFLHFWTSITPFVLVSWNIHFAGLDWSLNWPIWAFVDILSDDIVNPGLRLVDQGLFLGQFKVNIWPFLSPLLAYFCCRVFDGQRTSIGTIVICICRSPPSLTIRPNKKMTQQKIEREATKYFLGIQEITKSQWILLRCETCKCVFCILNSVFVCGISHINRHLWKPELGPFCQVQSILE